MSSVQDSLAGKRTPWRCFGWVPYRSSASTRPTLQTEESVPEYTASVSVPVPERTGRIGPVQRLRQKPGRPGFEKSDGTIRSLYNYICTPARNMFTKNLQKLCLISKAEDPFQTSDIKIDMINCCKRDSACIQRNLYFLVDRCSMVVRTRPGLRNKQVVRTDQVCLKLNTSSSSVFLMNEALWNKLFKAEQEMVTIAQGSLRLVPGGNRQTDCREQGLSRRKGHHLYAVYRQTGVARFRKGLYEICIQCETDFISTIQSYK